MLSVVEPKCVDHQEDDIKGVFKSICFWAMQCSDADEMDCDYLTLEAVVRSGCIDIGCVVCKLYAGYEEAILFSPDIQETIESQLMVLYHRVVQVQGHDRWNKIRVTIDNDVGQYDYQLEFKYDADLDWILEQEDQYTDTTYLALPPDIETRIESWDGLPNDYVRPWFH